MNGHSPALDADLNSEKGEEEELERWVHIQKEAFTNWCNDKLKGQNILMKDVKYDFRDGTTLCKLMEMLRNRPLKGRIISKSRLNWVTANGNIALAMTAMREDGINLVNIGPEDVVGGNTKLILGMVWLLIRRYQIGSQTKVPPKKLMLAWINAVCNPHLTIKNFSTDLNDGKALQGVIEYCRPGTCDEWWRLDRYQKLDNCSQGLDLAFEHFGIPHIITAKHLASGDMDELSGMTYMSYFMTVGACGFNATMRWLRETISPIPVSNFDTDWNSGLVASALVTVLGAEVGWPEINTDDNLNTCKKAIEVSSKEFRLPVDKFMSAKDMVRNDVDHIGVMAYAAWHRNGPDKRISISRPEGVVLPAEPEPVVPVMSPVPRISAPVEDSDSEDEVYRGRVVRFAPRPPSPPTPPLLEEEEEPDVYLELICRDVLPLMHVVSAEVLVHKKDTTWRSNASDLTGLFTAPSGATMEAEIFLLTDARFNLTFQPDETGTWFLDLFHRGEQTRDIPWRILVIDPRAARVVREMRDPVPPGTDYKFKVDISDLNHDTVEVCVQCLEQLIPYHITQHISSIDSLLVNFVAVTEGMYAVSVKCLDHNITGSPFEVGVAARAAAPAPPVQVQSLSASAVYATGRGLREGIQGVQAVFTVHISTDPGKKLEVQIKDPGGVSVKSIIADSNSVLGEVTEHSVFYTPETYGTHQVRVYYDRLEINDSPFYPEIKQPNIYVRDLNPVAILGRKHSFYLDASEAGKGTVMMDSNLPVVTYDKVEPGKYLVEVMPKKLGRHDLRVMLDEKEIEGSPFVVEVVKPEEPVKGFMKGPRTSQNDSRLMRDAFEY